MLLHTKRERQTSPSEWCSATPQKSDDGCHPQSVLLRTGKYQGALLVAASAAVMFRGARTSCAL